MWRGLLWNKINFNSTCTLYPRTHISRTLRFSLNKRTSIKERAAHLTSDTELIVALLRALPLDHHRKVIFFLPGSLGRHHVLYFDFWIHSPIFATEVYSAKLQTIADLPLSGDDKLVANRTHEGTSAAANRTHSLPTMSCCSGITRIGNPWWQNPGELKTLERQTLKVPLFSEASGNRVFSQPFGGVNHFLKCMCAVHFQGILENRHKRVVVRRFQRMISPIFLKIWNKLLLVFA